MSALSDDETCLVVQSGDMSPHSLESQRDFSLVVNTGKDFMLAVAKAIWSGEMLSHSKSGKNVAANSIDKLSVAFSIGLTVGVNAAFEN